MKLQVLAILLLISGCKAQSPTAGTVFKPDARHVRAYFKSLNNTRQTLSSGDEKHLSMGARHALVWLTDTFYKQREKEEVRTKFIVSRAVVGDAGAYELKRYAAKKFRPLIKGRHYIQVQYFPSLALACPEYHAVIDEDSLEVLSRWSEGA